MTSMTVLRLFVRFELWLRITSDMVVRVRMLQVLGAVQCCSVIIAFRSVYSWVNNTPGRSV